MMSCSAVEVYRHLVKHWYIYIKLPSITP